MWPVGWQGPHLGDLQYQCRHTAITRPEAWWFSRGHRGKAVLWGVGKKEDERGGKGRKYVASCN